MAINNQLKNEWTNYRQSQKFRANKRSATKMKKIDSRNIAHFGK